MEPDIVHTNTNTNTNSPPGHFPMAQPTPSARADSSDAVRLDERHFDQGDWDAWYQEQIQLSIEDSRPCPPHQDVVDWMERKLDDMQAFHVSEPAMIEWRPRALLRFDVLLSEVGERDPQAAGALGHEVTEKIAFALHSPYMHPRSSRVPGAREIEVTGNYLVPYRVTPEGIQVLDVVHAQRNGPDPSSSKLTG